MINRPRIRPRTSREMADLLSQKLSGLFKEKQVDFAYLGGSWAKNQNFWWSDIDIFVSIPDFLNLPSKAQLHLLTELHIRATELTEFEEIEINVLESVPLHVQFNVISDSIVLYERDNKVRSKFIEKLLPRYYDHMIWYKNMLNQSEYIPTSR